jgi:hypothetical protein
MIVDEQGAERQSNQSDALMKPCEWKTIDQKGWIIGYEIHSICMK